MDNLLKFYRWRAGLKQYELAGQLGCSPPYLSMVENSREQPNDEFKEKAAKALNIPKESLFPNGRDEVTLRLSGRVGDKES